MLTLQEVINEEMKNPEFKAEWDALEPEFQSIRSSIEDCEMDTSPENGFVKKTAMYHTSKTEREKRCKAGYEQKGDQVNE